MTTMIITIGSRDLQLFPAFASSPLNSKIDFREGEEMLNVTSPRKLGAALMENPELLEQVREYLAYPIIKPSLEYVYDKEPTTINKILFICTNNLENANTRHRSNDTLYYPKIIEYLIKKDFRQKNAEAIKYHKVEVRENLTSLSYMYDYFAQKFSEPRSLFSFAKEEKVYLHAQGGIDAINFALLLKLLEYKKDLRYLHLPEGSKVSYLMPFPQRFIHGMNEQRIVHALKSYYYESVEDATNDSIINCLSRYAKFRIALNHKRALKEARNYLDTNPRDQYFGIRMANEVESLTLKDLEKELYFAAMIKYAQGNYADYLWRLFTIHDNLLTPIIENYLGGPIIYEKSGEHAQWKALLAPHKELLEYLNNQKVGPEKVPLAWDFPNKYAFRCIFDFLYMHVEKPSQLMEIDKNMEKLAPLRNSIAHHYQGVSLEQIDETLGKKMPSEKFNYLLATYLGLSPKEMGIYDDINQRINQRLQEIAYSN